MKGEETKERKRFMLMKKNDAKASIACKLEPASRVPSDYPELPRISKWEETAVVLKVAAFILLMMGIGSAINYFGGG
ncbi:MAG: hypothetical protein ACJ74Y_05195 [Bryobacteraceae bacterium]